MRTLDELRTVSWMITASRGVFNFDHPRPADVNIDDVAHALSHQCRFNGHTPYYYSVAEHCINVAALVPAEHKVAAFLHDAAEAYIGDLITPLKKNKALAEAFAAIEARVVECIRLAFGISAADWDAAAPFVDAADKACLVEEVRMLFDIDPVEAWSYEEPKLHGLSQTLFGIPPTRAEKMYLQTAAGLGISTALAAQG